MVVRPARSGAVSGHAKPPTLRRWISACAVVGATLAGSVLAAEPASAALAVRVVNTDGDGVSSRSAPQIAARNGYGAPKGATVVTQCWTWGDSVGPYSNRLWWLVSYAGRQFYIADRYLTTPNVANQPPASEPQCGATAPPQATSRAQQAVNWARARVGQQAYSGWCLLFVYDAYRSAGVDIGASSSAVTWANAHRGQLSTNGTPPMGALVFWWGDSYNADGHVAISLGDGTAVSTTERSFNGIHIMNIADRNRTKPYAGWITVA